jgi:uncharacterized protein YjbI with pentapeptide repeats
MQQTQLEQRNRLSDLEIAKEHRDQDVYLAAQLKLDTILEYYKQSVGSLLAATTFDNNALSAIRALTLSAVRQLSNYTGYKGEIVQFLYDAHLLEQETFVVDLLHADLSAIQLNNRSLKNLKMRGVKLHNASFAHSDISNAQLLNCDFNGADFTGAVIRRSKFGVNLANWNEKDKEGDACRMVQANFSCAQMTFCDFGQTDLRYAIFVNAILNGTDFGKANLQYANFSGAQLIRAVFFGADLFGAVLNDHQLFRQATSLTGAVLPNGTKIPDKIIPFNRSTQVDHVRPCTNHLRRKTTAVYSDRLRQSYTTFYGILRSS